MVMLMVRIVLAPASVVDDLTHLLVSTACRINNMIIAKTTTSIDGYRYYINIILNAYIYLE